MSHRFKKKKGVPGYRRSMNETQRLFAKSYSRQGPENSELIHIVKEDYRRERKRDNVHLQTQQNRQKETLKGTTTSLFLGN